MLERKKPAQRFYHDANGDFKTEFNVAQPHLLHAALRRTPRLPVEELGGHLAVTGSLPDVPELTYRGGALSMSDEGRRQRGRAP